MLVLHVDKYPGEVVLRCLIAMLLSSCLEC